MRWIIAVFSLLAALIISEQAVRVLHPAPQVFRFFLGEKDSAYQLSSNPALAYELKPNIRSDHPDCHNSFDYTNSFGQRDSERSIEKLPGKKRYLMLGDSVVAGH